MACGNCTNCGDSSKGPSQKSLVAYIQPCGASPTNTNYNAMDDGNYGSNIKITAGKRSIRGTRTTKYRRQSSGTVKASHLTEGTPDNNTLTVEFAQQGCAGYSPEELAAEGSFDVYNFQACCGSATPGSDWSKCHVYRCVSFNDLTFSDETSYNTDDDNDLTHQFSANYYNDYYLYSQTVSEVLGATGVALGTRIDSMVYRGEASGCASNCKDDCANYWYAVNDAGRVFYRRGSSRSIENQVITGFVGTSTFNRIGIVGDLLVVATQGGYYTTTLDSYDAPGTWAFTAVANLFPDDVLSIGDGVVIYGSLGAAVATATYRVLTVNANGVATTNYTSATIGQIVDYDKCGNIAIAGGTTGLTLVGSSCASLSAVTSPAAAANIQAVAVQPGGRLWAGTSTGTLWYSEDSGTSWTQVTLPVAATIIRDIVWADQGVGYILHSATGVLTTIDGGNTWSTTGSDKRIASVSGATQLTRINTPCCTSTSKEMNNFMIAGIATGGVGGLWQGVVSSCS